MRKNRKQTVAALLAVIVLMVAVGWIYWQQLLRPTVQFNALAEATSAEVLHPLDSSDVAFSGDSDDSPAWRFRSRSLYCCRQVAMRANTIKRIIDANERTTGFAAALKSEQIPAATEAAGDSIFDLRVFCEGELDLSELPLSRLTSLRTLTVYNGKIVGPLARDVTIQRLSLDGITIRESNLHKLLQNPHLREVELRYCKISSGSAGHWAPSPKLRTLVGVGEATCQWALANANSLSQLEALILLEPGACDGISGFTNLSYLGVTHSDFGMNHFVKLRTEHLKQVTVGKTKLTTADLPQLRQLAPSTMFFIQ